MLTRRHFLRAGFWSGIGLAALRAAPASALPRWLTKDSAKALPGTLYGPNIRLGHRLRDSAMLAETTRDEQTDVIILGGGIAGLGAGYQLAKQRTHQFMLLEMEGFTGGNSHSGENAVSRYPWGAHYVPLTVPESTEVRALFEELGIIEGYDAAGLPRYNEYYLCSDPHERLYMRGRWQEGLVPNVGLTQEEDEQHKRFFAFIESCKKAVGNDGKRAFVIPLDRSSADPAWRALDTLSMAEWMRREGYDCATLRWYVDYCCRDDYGALADAISAWAGIHYFASRGGQGANAESGTVLTWPEGNGWLAAKLAQAIQPHIRTRCMATRVTKTQSGVEVVYWDDAAQQSVRVTAKSAILAMPHFIAARLLNEPASGAKDFTYSPWAIANITLSSLPKGPGNELSWDNVMYQSRLLGYVNATHQSLAMQPKKTVLTYYWPLSHLPPADARKEALQRPKAYWQQAFAQELFLLHPELKDAVESMDIWVWGHAMIRPTPGFIWGEARKHALQQRAPIFTAHSDLSGVSIFEEAYTHGVRAAHAAIAHLSHSQKKAG